MYTHKTFSNWSLFKLIYILNDIREYIDKVQSLKCDTFVRGIVKRCKRKNSMNIAQTKKMSSKAKMLTRRCLYRNLKRN